MGDHMPAHIGTMGVIESAAIGFPDGGPCGGNDDGFSHCDSPSIIARLYVRALFHLNICFIYTLYV
jgi:hypothetical protein